VGKHGVNEMRGQPRHPPPATTRTEAASFARERHETLEGAGFASHACEASAERAAREELPELALDKAREPATVGAFANLAQEGLQVLADDAMEDGAVRAGASFGRWREEESRRTLATLGSAYRMVLPDLDLDPCAYHILGCLEELPGRPLVRVLFAAVGTDAGGDTLSTRVMFPRSSVTVTRPVWGSAFLQMTQIMAAFSS
jgi:hypothetical protein